ncbi:MAG: NTP transferase domain-containing protein [Candidatus Nitrohelix vancouverensis]|uniref:NTP transferase domain-containing protein n=1 Tax=Candidatus Nitrohelix vancouverensis TaxID=2705534 RepID=A0A7T0C032_9BACT|nr:MAG: NTP transferase domain-containing protein [Candidatus Nitrohelix vancouverensis]
MDMKVKMDGNKYDVVLVAGEGESSYKIYRQHKAFLPIQAKSIISYVVESLQQVESVQDIFVVGSKTRLSGTFEKDEIDLNYPKTVRVVEQKRNLYENIWSTFLQTLPNGGSPEELEQPEIKDKAVLIVPCDSPLLTPHEVEHFISRADVDNFDHILGLTPEEALQPFYPQEGKPGIKMAYLHLKEKSYRINNLHLVKPLRIANRAYIQKMYQYRYQRNFKNFILFGLSLFGKDKFQHYPYYIGLELCLFFSALHMDSMVNYFRKWIPKKELEGCISTILKTRFTSMEVPYPGAALDIDNHKDYEAMIARFDEWRDQLSSPVLRPAPINS